MLIALEDPPELRFLLRSIDLLPDVSGFSDQKDERSPRRKRPAALAQVLEEAVQVLDDGVGSPKGDPAEVAREVQ